MASESKALPESSSSLSTQSNTPATGVDTATLAVAGKELRNLAHKNDKAAEELQAYLTAEKLQAYLKVLINAAGPESGDTALHCAARQGNLEKIRILLATPGVNSTPRNKKGQTPWHLFPNSMKEKCPADLRDKLQEPWEKEGYIEFSPSTPCPPVLATATLPLSADSKIDFRPTAEVLQEHKRIWFSGICAKPDDKIPVKMDATGKLQSDISYEQLVEGMKYITERVVLCSMGEIGVGVFVRPGQVIRAGTFIPADGVFVPNAKTKDKGLKGNYHIWAYGPRGDSIGVLNPVRFGSLSDLLQHAPNEMLDDMGNNCVNDFDIDNAQMKSQIATANFSTTRKYCNGIERVGLRANVDISEGQLLWAYAQAKEFYNKGPAVPRKGILLFDRKGNILPPTQYRMKTVRVIAKFGEEPQILNIPYLYIRESQQIATMTSYTEFSTGTEYILRIPVERVAIELAANPNLRECEVDCQVVETRPAAPIAPISSSAMFPPSPVGTSTPAATPAAPAKRGFNS